VRDSVPGFVWTPPHARCRAYAAVQARADTDFSTPGTGQVAGQVTDSIRALLDQLVRFYPAGHFGSSASAFIDSVLQRDARWLDLVNQPAGVGRSGTISRTATALAVRSRAERMVEELGLVGRDPDFATDAWLRAWRQSRSAAPH
jgi:hypothetical protein